MVGSCFTLDSLCSRFALAISFDNSLRFFRYISFFNFPTYDHSLFSSLHSNLVYVSLAFASPSTMRSGLSTPFFESFHSACRSGRTSVSGKSFSPSQTPTYMQHSSCPASWHPVPRFISSLASFHRLAEGQLSMATSMQRRTSLSMSERYAVYISGLRTSASSL